MNLVRIPSLFPSSLLGPPPTHYNIHYKHSQTTNARIWGTQIVFRLRQQLLLSVSHQHWPTSPTHELLQKTTLHPKITTTDTTTTSRRWHKQVSSHTISSQAEILSNSHSARKSPPIHTSTHGTTQNTEFSPSDTFYRQSSTLQHTCILVCH